MRIGQLLAIPISISKIQSFKSSEFPELVGMLRKKYEGLSGEVGDVNTFGNRLPRQNGPGAIIKTTLEHVPIGAKNHLQECLTHKIKIDFISGQYVIDDQHDIRHLLASGLNRRAIRFNLIYVGRGGSLTKNPRAKRLARSNVQKVHQVEAAK